MRYVICINNPDNLVSLHLNTVYKVDTDQKLPAGLIAIFDEEGESYIYSDSLFVEIPMNQRLENTFSKLYI